MRRIGKVYTNGATSIVISISKEIRVKLGWLEPGTVVMIEVDGDRLVITKEEE